MTPLEQIAADKTAIKRVAKLLAKQCFRNTIEDLHCGTSPSSKTGDFSDVVVRSPYGEIAGCNRMVHQRFW